MRGFISHLLESRLQCSSDAVSGAPLIRGAILINGNAAESYFRVYCSDLSAYKTDSKVENNRGF
jgi:hypothetical protein